MKLTDLLGHVHYLIEAAAWCIGAALAATAVRVTFARKGRASDRSGR